MLVQGRDTLNIDLENLFVSPTFDVQPLKTTIFQLSATKNTVVKLNFNVAIPVSDDVKRFFATVLGVEINNLTGEEEDVIFQEFVDGFFPGISFRLTEVETSNVVLRSRTNLRLEDIVFLDRVVDDEGLTIIQEELSFQQLETVLEFEVRERTEFLLDVSRFLVSLFYQII